MRRLAVLRWYVVGLAFGLASVAAAGRTYAAFSSTTTNPGNSFSAAASFCVSPGTQTVNPDADSYVDQNSAASNFGSANPIVVDARSGRAKRVYVHFSLPAVPRNCSVTSAVLRMNATSAVTGRTLQAYQAASSWTESGITWTNQPGTTGTAATASSATGWVSWTVTSQTQALYSGTNTGFVVRDSSETAGAGVTQNYSSRSAASNKPELQVTFG